MARSSKQIIHFKLALPPSINAMYRRNPHSYGLYKTAEAKQWISDSLIQMRLQRVPRRKIIGHGDVTANFYFKHERDIDGGVKPLLDLLQEYGLFENDRNIYSLFLTKDFDKKNPRVELDIVDN